MNLFNFSPYLKYYGLTVLFVKTETTNPFFNAMFRLLIYISDVLSKFQQSCKFWQKAENMDKTDNFGEIKIEAIVKHKDYKMLSKNHNWLEFSLFTNDSVNFCLESLICCDLSC